MPLFPQKVTPLSQLLSVVRPLKQPLKSLLSQSRWKHQLATQGSPTIDVRLKCTSCIHRVLKAVCEHWHIDGSRMSLGYWHSFFNVETMEQDREYIQYDNNKTVRECGLVNGSQLVLRPLDNVVLCD